MGQGISDVYFDYPLFGSSVILENVFFSNMSTSDKICVDFVELDYLFKNTS